MKLHQKVIESAAVGAVAAGDIAVGPAMPLFSKLTKRSIPKIIQVKWKRKEKRNGLGLKESFYNILGEDNTYGQKTYDTTETISKLKALENKDKVEKHDTQEFGLRDDKGNLVTVTVRNDQAANFEAALQALLAQRERDAEEGEGPEVAEILFKLKDHFDIVDVTWPEVEEDEEEDQQLAGGEEGMQDMEGGDLEGMVAGEEGGDMGGMGGGTDEVKSLLTQVIDMMKADAEARKAEAHAKAAEAKQREAEAAAKEALHKVRQEEQILDMEAYEKQKKEEQKEAKRLAQLARWKHEMKSEEGADFEDSVADLQVKDLVKDKGSAPGAGEENEEILRRAPSPLIKTAPKPPPTKGVGGRVAPADVAKFILSRVK